MKDLPYLATTSVGLWAIVTGSFSTVLGLMWLAHG